MNPVNRTLPAVSSAVQTTLRQLAICLVGVAVLPPVLWATLSQPLRQWLAGPLPGTGSLVLSTAVVAGISAILTGVLWFLMFVRPVRLIRRTERKLRAMAMRDGLTGLLNREGILVALNHAISAYTAKDGGLGVMILNLDKFRLINWSLGEASSDLLLVLAAERIQAVVRETDPVARLGGDQYAIVVSGNAGVRGMYVMARNLQRAFEKPFVVESRSAVLTPTIGLAVYGDPAGDADELIVNAEAAVRSGKDRGGARICRYESSMHVDSNREIEVNVRLREALRNDQFKLLYQPVMAADGKSVVATEALLRWIDPVAGVVSPAEFIPILEQTGLITEVGHWVLQTACRQGRLWRDSGATGLVLSVNVSPRQFAEPDFVQSVSRVIDETGFPPDRLQLEITESILLDPTRDVLTKLDALTSRGIRLALDDFGMGYSSLSYLKRYPLHTLKMDQYFVRDLPDSAPDCAIAHAIVALGHGLGLHVTAEGVETDKQFEALAAMGCDSLQGFLFARPIEVAEMSRRLQEQAAAGVEMTVPARPQLPQACRVMPSSRRVRVLRNGETLAESADAVWVIEAQRGGEPTLYLPRDDVRVRLGENEEPSGREEPGDRCYFDLLGSQDQVVSSRIAWGHPPASPQSAQLAERIAFVPAEVRIEEFSR